MPSLHRWCPLPACHCTSISGSFKVERGCIVCRGERRRGGGGRGWERGGRRQMSCSCRAKITCTTMDKPKGGVCWGMRDVYVVGGEERGGGGGGVEGVMGSQSSARSLMRGIYAGPRGWGGVGGRFVRGQDANVGRHCSCSGQT